MQLVGPLLERQDDVRAFHAIDRAADQEAGRLVHAEGVAGQLLGDETVIRPILVQGEDDVIAIRPGVWPWLVHLEAVALGETHHVEPVPRPALAVVRRGQILSTSRS